MFLDVKVAVDQTVPQRAGVGAVHRDDGVADLPGGAGVLPSDSGGGVALLLLAGLVEDQYRTGCGQVTYGEVPHRVAGTVLVPDGLVEQALRPEGPRLPRVLGHGPAVLARQVGQQATHVRAGVRPRLAAGEQRGQLRGELVELLLEQRGIYADGRGRLIFMLRHNTMINRWPRSCPATPAPPVAPLDHEVRLEYLAADPPSSRSRPAVPAAREEEPWSICAGCCVGAGDRAGLVRRLLPGFSSRLLLSVDGDALR